MAANVQKITDSVKCAAILLGSSGAFFACWQPCGPWCCPFFLPAGWQCLRAAGVVAQRRTASPPGQDGPFGVAIQAVSGPGTACFAPLFGLFAQLSGSQVVTLHVDIAVLLGGIYGPAAAGRGGCTVRQGPPFFCFHGAHPLALARFFCNFAGAKIR